MPPAQNGHAPTRDIGSTDLTWGTYGQGLLSDWWETTGDLIWPQSIITYAKMRKDPQLTPVLAAYALPMLRATWALDPDGCKPEVVQHCADDLGVMIIGDDKPGPARRRGVIWQRHLSKAVQHLDYGHMPFERRYVYDKAGAAHLDNLGERPPWTIAFMKVNKDGTLESIEQTTQTEPITADRLVWYVKGLIGANWAGESALRPAFGAWLLKHEGWRVLATSSRRFGMGVPMVEAPPGAGAPQLAQAQLLASAMRVGDQAGIGMPAGFKASLMGMSGGTPDTLGWVRYLDQVMAKMALLGLLELGQTETGSRALGESFLDFFLLSLQAVADEIATTATSGHPGMPGIITDLVNQNWGEDEPAPRLVCLNVGESYQITSEALAGLVTCGALTPDASLDAWVRKTWGLPKRVTPWVPSSKGLPAGTSVKPAVEQQYAEQAVKQYGVSDQPTTSKPPATAKPAQPAAAAGRRREQECGFNAAAHQQQWQTALDGLIASYHRVASAQRVDLVDQVTAAAGRPGRLALDPPPLGDGPRIIINAMQWAAAQSVAAMMMEAAGQGVMINQARVKVDAVKLAGIAQARAQVAASALAQAASGKALQVTAAASPPPLGISAQVTEVASFLDGMTDRSLREHLGAALTAAQNLGRTAVMRAAPQSRNAVYVATELLDNNTCKPCHDEDGREFTSIAEAEAAYPMGGFRDCAGFARCRGTVMAVWSPESVTASAWSELEHPRIPGGKGGGRFARKSGGVVPLPPVSGVEVAQPSRFLVSFNKAFKGSPFEAFVNHYSVSEMKSEHMTPLLAEGGKAGVLIHDHRDGRIEATALFNTSDTPGVGVRLLREAIDNHGVNYVECFGPALPRLYSKVGFADDEVYPFDPTQAPPGWNSARFDQPDYHTMRLAAGQGQVAAAALVEGIDVGAAMDDAAAEDPGWWAQYGQDAEDAARVLFGIDPPGGGGGPKVTARFNPGEHRDLFGRWTMGGGGHNPEGALKPKGRFTMAGVPDDDPLWGKVDKILGTPQVKQRGEGKGQMLRPALPPYRDSMARCSANISDTITRQGTLEQGKAWYPKEHALAERRAAKYHVPVQVAAAVESATSPRCQYSTNQRVTEEILAKVPKLGKTARELAASRQIGGGIFRTLVDDAVEITLGGTGAIDGNLTGVKRRSFYDNIMWPGQTDAVTVDTWMMRPMQALGLTGDQADALAAQKSKDFPEGIGKMLTADATRDAAARMGLSPDEVQAAYWIAAQKEAHIGNAGKQAVAAAADPPWDVLDDDHYDAELLLEYLQWRQDDIPGRIDLGPPSSAKSDGSLAAGNPAAWALARADPRWGHLGLTAQEAMRIAGGGASPKAASAKGVFEELLHPRDEHGRFARKTGLKPGGRKQRAEEYARRLAELRKQMNGIDALMQVGKEFPDLANKPANVPIKAPSVAKTPSTARIKMQLTEWKQTEYNPDAQVELAGAWLAVDDGNWTKAADHMRSAAIRAEKPDDARQYAAYAKELSRHQPMTGHLGMDTAGDHVRMKWDKPPQINDRVEDSWGDPGSITGVVRPYDGKGNWVTVKWDNGRKAIITPDGRVDDVWWPTEETREQRRAFQRLEGGLLPYPPSVKTPISPPGDYLAPGVKQLTLPGMPARSSPSGTKATSARLEAAIASNNADESVPGEDAVLAENIPEDVNYFGNTADTRIVTFADGSTWVRKRGKRMSRREMQNEVGYGIVSGIFGSGSPQPVIRDNPDTGEPEEWQPFLDHAQTAIEWAGQDPDWDEYDPDLASNDPMDMYTSEGGTLVGITDKVTNAGDRHLGNWMIKNGEPVAIDNGKAFGGFGDSPFAEALDPSELAQRYPAAQWDRWQQELEAAEPELDTLNLDTVALLEAFSELRQEVGA